MNHIDAIIWWLISLLATLTVVCARLGFMLFGMSPNPPEDPVLLAHWHRKRRWLTISELSALPSFATIAVALQIYGEMSPIASVLISMILGALGFGFLLDGLKTFVRRRLELEDTP